MTTEKGGLDEGDKGDKGKEALRGGGDGGGGERWRPGSA